MVLTFQEWRFQRWRQASLWTAKKIRRQRIRLLEEESNARGACRIIGGNLTSRFLYDWEPWEWFKNKKIGCFMNWNRETLEDDFSLANSCFKDNREKVFCIGLWLEMRNRYSTTTPRRKNTTLSPVNRCHRPQHQHHGRTFMVRRSCCIWWD